MISLKTLTRFIGLNRPFSRLELTDTALRTTQYDMKLTMLVKSKLDASNKAAFQVAVAAAAIIRIVAAINSPTVVAQ